MSDTCTSCGGMSPEQRESVELALKALDLLAKEQQKDIERVRILLRAALVEKPRRGDGRRKERS